MPYIHILPQNEKSRFGEINPKKAHQNQFLRFGADFNIKARMKALETIFNILDNNPSELKAWFDAKWQGLTPVPYFSCDIRHAKYKMGIVDTNLFAAGFNNLCSSYSKKVIENFKSYLDEFHPQAQTIALLAENHTRNKFYLLNVAKLQQLITQTGRTCLVTLILPDYPQNEINITLDQNTQLSLFKPEIQNHNLYLGQTKMDLILSNNDFSSVLPQEWQTLTTPIVLNQKLGWLYRTKSQHFDHLQAITTDLGQTFDFDPWRIMPRHSVVQNVNPDNIEIMATQVDHILEQIKTKYDQYGISETPYCFIKNNSGTYGLGMMTATSGAELLQTNRKTRQKLFAKKGESQNSEFLIQEGIPTHDFYSENPIEPVIYGVGRKAVAGFFRMHEGKDAFESLNSPGMSFSCLCLHKLDEPHEADFIDCCSKRDLVKGSLFLADLAALASAYENQQAQSKK